MKSIRILSLLVGLLGFGGCSLFYTTVKPAPEKPFYDALPGALDDDYFHSPIGDLAGRYPKDWLLTNIEHIPELENMGFVYRSPDGAWALTLREIPGSADLRRRFEKDGLLAIAEESINEHRTLLPGLRISRSVESFREHGMQFANYEVARGEGEKTLHARHVVFTTGVRFYELAMTELRDTAPLKGYLENYRLLQSVISSLEGVPTRQADGK